MQNCAAARIVICIASLLLPAAPAAGATDLQAVLVVDASAGTWRRLDDGSSALVSVRTAISDLLASTATVEGVELGLRFLGSDVPFTDDGACQDTRLAVPVSALDRDRLVAAFDDTLPTGSRPLIRGLVRAAADVEDPAARRRIILIAAGEDSCFGDQRKAAAALAGGVELRIIGLDLGEAALKRFSAAVPTHNVKTTGELAAALRWALMDDEHDSVDPAIVRLKIVPEGALPSGTRVLLRRSVTDTTVELESNGDTLQGSAPPGSYTVQATAQSIDIAEAGPIALTAGATDSYTLDIGPTPPVTLEVNPASPVAGGEIFVQFWGAPEGRHWVAVAPAGKPLDAWTARSLITESAGEVRLRLPVAPQSLEIRFIERRSESLDRVIGRLDLTSEPPQASLELPESTIVDTNMVVEWQGPDLPGDHLNVAPEGLSPALHTACVFTTRGSPVSLPAPSRTGTYVVRYVSGVSGRALAVKSVEVLPLPVSLTVPEQVHARHEFAVSWAGSTVEGDYVLMTEPGATADDYLLLRPASSSGQATFEAPAVAGQYEIMYVGGEKDHIRAQQSFEVFAVDATLEAPATVRAGTRFKVNWAGPDAPGDLITVAPPKSLWNGRFDWVHTSLGTPADLAAPFDPGEYELRYISTRDRKILARVPIQVE